jgi:predicted nucleic acid-binding protein
MSDDLVVADTDVPVYAYDADAAEHHDLATSVLSELWDSRAGVVSSQVHQEYHVTVTR